MSKYLNKIISTTLATLLGAAVVWILIFGPRTAGDVHPERVHVRYWEKWTGLEGEQAKQIVDAFNATVGKKKGIWVDFVSMSQIDRKTLISTAAGVPPDVAGLWGDQVLEFASLNALEPLDAYAAKYGLRRELYKPAYYEGCLYQGHLYALPSTAWCVALLWNKEVFQQRAAELRAAGLDPNRSPRTISELDRYAAALNTWDNRSGGRALKSAGFVPMEPGSFTNFYCYWFGGSLVNPAGTRMTLLTPQVVQTYNWIRGYSERIGLDQLETFRSGFNSGATGISDTPQNPFLIGAIAMEQQGPWQSAFIEKLKPSMNRWHMPREQLEREQNFEAVQVGMSRSDVEQLLGPGDRDVPPDVPTAGANLTLHWKAGLKDVFVSFRGDQVAGTDWRLLPAKERQQYCQWGAAPFPDVSGSDSVTYAGMDVWVIPRTAKHKREAFEFLAFASRQAQIEKLCMLHCNLSPLVQESANYLKFHPNPYIDVYEKLAAGPGARPLPHLVNWPQINDELTQAAERSATLDGTTGQILSETQTRCQEELDKALGLAGRPLTMATDSDRAPRNLR